MNVSSIFNSIQHGETFCCFSPFRQKQITENCNLNFNCTINPKHNQILNNKYDRNHHDLTFSITTRKSKRFTCCNLPILGGKKDEKVHRWSFHSTSGSWIWDPDPFATNDVFCRSGQRSSRAVCQDLVRPELVLHVVIRGVDGRLVAQPPLHLLLPGALRQLVEVQRGLGVLHRAVAPSPSLDGAANRGQRS